MRRSISSYFTLFFISVVSTVLVWFPFILKYNGTSSLDVYRHFDGPLYIVVAKTFYNKNLIDALQLETNLSPAYFAAHLPLYPMFIGLLSFLGYLKSTLVVTVLSTVALAGILFFMLKRLQLTRHPLLLTAIFLFLPRFLIVRSVGSPESLFIGLVLLSLFFFEKKNYLLAGLFGALSCMTKTPGILLFPTYALALAEQVWRTKSFKWSSLSILLVPVGLIVVFAFYFIQTGDFWAYFHTSAVVPMPYPFSVFNFKAQWVDTAWLEDIIFYFFLYALTAITLWKSRHRSFFYFILIFFVATMFVEHRDISRYGLPMWPMAVIAFEKFFTSKKFVLALVILLPAIYLYAWNFMGHNVMPISNWAPYL